MTEKITIEISSRAPTVDQPRLTRTVRHTLDRLGVTEATVSLAVVGHDEMAQLKHRYFDRLETTDVISFDLRDEAEPSTLDCEIVVNAQQAADQAQAAGADREAELNLYVVHGLLHQLGYDDQDEIEAQAMHEKEDELLQELGFGRVFQQEEGTSQKT